jgi:hypothetical protein
MKTKRQLIVEAVLGVILGLGAFLAMMALVSCEPQGTWCPDNWRTARTEVRNPMGTDTAYGCISRTINGYRFVRGDSTEVSIVGPLAMRALK